MPLGRMRACMASKVTIINFQLRHLKDDEAPLLRLILRQVGSATERSEGLRAVPLKQMQF